MRHILDDLISSLEKGRSVVLGTVIRSSGSAPRTSGARIMIGEDATLTGTIGGGPVEGACQAKARELFADSSSYAELDFSLSGTSAAKEGMVCGGSVSVLLHRVEAEALETLIPIRNDYRQGKRPLLGTLLPQAETPPRFIELGTNTPLTIPAELKEKMNGKNSRVPFLTSLNNNEVFVEPMVSPGIVHIIGAGHVALATAQLAAFAGFEVMVLDDREEFANKDRYPEAREVLVVDSFDNCLGELSLDDYVVIVTRGHLHDRDVLAQALATEAGYIGMIGSKKKREVIYDSLRKENISEAELQRVHSPIGLNIGADTPNEIALSIVGELVQVRSKFRR